MDLAQVKRELANSRRALLEVVGQVDPRLLEEPPPHGGWSVALVLEHLERVESGMVRRVAREFRRGTFPPADPLRELPIDLTKTRGVTDRTVRVESPNRSAPLGELAPKDAPAALARSREAALQLLDEMAPYDVSSASLPHFLFGELNLLEWIVFLAGHERRHTLQLREIANSHEEASLG